MFPPELYRQALEIEFSLSYIGKLGSIESWQSCPVGERDWHYKKLQEVKAEEKRRHDEDMAKIEAAKAASRHRRGR